MQSLSKRVNNKGKATPRYAIASMKILIFCSPNFQFVRSITSFKFSFSGNNENINLAIKSLLKSKLAINLCNLLKLESALLEESKDKANL